MERAYANVILQIRDFIRTTLSEAGFSHVVVNISGGVDSAVMAALALEAVGPQHLFLAVMPYGASGTPGINNAMLLVEALHLPKEQCFLLDIKRAVDTIVEQTVAPDRVRLGNIMARVRMIYLFDLAKRLGVLVCGTENRTEQYLGYFTRFGDEASDLEPIRNLYKTQVWELARVNHLGLRRACRRICFSQRRTPPTRERGLRQPGRGLDLPGCDAAHQGGCWQALAPRGAETHDFPHGPRTPCRPSPAWGP